MFQIVDVFQIGKNLSVTFEGKCDTIKNGCQLKDSNGNIYNVISVAMTRYDDSSDISKSTTVLLAQCNLQKGNILYIA